MNNEEYYKEQITLYLKMAAKTLINQIKEFQDKVKEMELMDKQFFLNFQDDLNKLSLDPDRE